MACDEGGRRGMRVARMPLSGGTRSRAFRLNSSLINALEQIASQQSVSVNTLVNKVLSRAVERGLARRVAKIVRDAMLAEAELEDWYVAHAQEGRRADVMKKWREGMVSRDSALKQLRRLERIARHHRDLSMGNKEEWEAQRRQVVACIKEVSAQREITEKPVKPAKQAGYTAWVPVEERPLLMEGGRLPMPPEDE